MVYVPEFETQRDESAPLPWTNCTAASAAMLADQWSLGAAKTSDVELRRVSPVPLDQGMNFKQVAAALRARLPQLGDLLYSERDGSGNRNQTWAQLREHLVNDGGAIVCGHYSSLAGAVAATGLKVDRWQPGGTFGHAVFVCDNRPAASGGDGRVLWMDPLGHGNYAGDRIRLEDLWAFIWRNGNGPAALVTAAHGFTAPRPEPGPFRDVPGDAWYAAAVQRLADAGILAGYPDGTYRPSDKVSRAELAAALDALREDG